MNYKQHILVFSGWKIQDFKAIWSFETTGCVPIVIFSKLDF